MPWTKDDMKRKHPKVDDATAERMAAAGSDALEKCLAEGKSQSECEGVASRVANSLMSGGQKMSDENTSAVMLAPIGTWNTAKYGKMEINHDFVEKVMANFDSRVMNEREPFIDDEHDEGSSNGWFKKLYVGEVEPDSDAAKYGIKEALYGEVEWTEPGKDKIDGGVYKYISPHFAEYQDPVTGKKHWPVLKNAAFTNIPVFSMMPSLAMSEHVVEFMCSEDYDKTIIVNLAETQDEKAAPTAKSPVSEKASETIDTKPKGGHNMEETTLDEKVETETTPEEKPATDEVAELKAKLAQAEAKLSEAEAAKSDSEKRLDAIEKELAAAKTLQKEQAADAFVAKALSDKKMVPAQQETIRELYLADSELAEKVIESAPEVKLSEEKGKESNAGETPDKEDLLAKHQERVDFYMSEEGGSYGWNQAFSMADRDVKIPDEGRFAEAVN